jgi:hypothetical protein
MDEDIIETLALFLIIFVPVAGITARIAIKPIVEAFTKYMQVRQGTEGMELLERRMALLEQELGATRAEVQSLSEARDFDRQIAAGSPVQERPRIAGS